ncbi:hypothetical protein Q6287_27815, partial [Klebsiella pneumoniae]|nr:hypothetical protein [Klebsiella pneumoniae]
AGESAEPRTEKEHRNRKDGPAPLVYTMTVAEQPTRQTKR